MNPRDLDQIHADIRSAKHSSKCKSGEPVEDLPGLGRHHCVECARWFEGERNLIQHRKGKNHKRRYLCLGVFSTSLGCGYQADIFQGFVHYVQSHTRRGRLKLPWGSELINASVMTRRLRHLKSNRLLWKLELHVADDL